MEYSDYQKKIFDFVKNGTENGSVIACAGGAKTTTAVESMKFVSPMTDVQFNAFGKEIATELANRTRTMMNVQVNTFNSFGWQACLNSLSRKPGLDKDKTEHILKYQIFNNLSNDEDRKRFYSSKNLITRMVSLFKAFACFDLNEAESIYPFLLERYDFDLPKGDWFYQVLLNTYIKCINEHQVMDFDDQIFMPIHLNLNIPTVDLLMIDEAQDVNEIKIRLVKESIRNKGRLLAIGDPWQAIYGFTGSKPDSMNELAKQFETTELPLYICYRCSKSVVTEAKTIVDHIEPWDLAKEGSVDTISKDESVKLVKADDFVLCRTTEPLVRYCLARIRESKEAYVKGRDIGENLINLIDRIPNSHYMAIELFFDELNAFVANKISDLSRFGKDQHISLLEDQLATISVLIEDCKSVTDLKNKILSIFKAHGSGIQCMTIHRSKGLETKNVFILRPDLIPHPKSKKDWMLEEELRLKYVAITRSRNELYYVKKDENEK